mmetsp:Transcript_29672/g.45382  ORF Transcript_29672/g.45382 Transcript_29672/m.45382 type:complete len:377 (+) Transcript_29672:102-1232(+)
MNLNKCKADEVTEESLTVKIEPCSEASSGSCSASDIPVESPRTNTSAVDPPHSETEPVEASASVSKKGKVKSNKGRHGDPRMHRAVAARLMNPELSLLESLIEGGFSFPDGTEGSGKSDRNIYDSDRVLLCQRKNQLSRRLRLAKKRQQATRAEVGIYPPGIGQQDSNNDSRSLQNMLLNGQLPNVPGGSIQNMLQNGQLPNVSSGRGPNVDGNNEMPMMPPQFGMFVGQGGPSGLDQTSFQGQDPSKNQMPKNNFEQYLQLASRSMGLRPEQLHALQFSGSMGFPGYPATNPFQQFALAQQSQNFLASMDPNGMNNSNGLQQQNIQMQPIMPMPGSIGAPVPAQMTNDVSRFLMNRSMLLNGTHNQEQPAENKSA